MHKIIKSTNTEENYATMTNVIKEQLLNENDLIANLSSVSAFINVYMEDINWVGFYILKDELVLGPFQGGPACIRIKIGNGVCGTAVKDERIIRVDNVYEFPGHIACDASTKSEIVLPIICNNKVFGVLDIDSPLIARFGELEEKYLKEITHALQNFLKNNFNK